MSASDYLEGIHRPDRSTLENDNPESSDKPCAAKCRHIVGSATESRRRKGLAIEA